MKDGGEPSDFGAGCEGKTDEEHGNACAELCTIVHGNGDGLIVESVDLGNGKFDFAGWQSNCDIITVVVGFGSHGTDDGSGDGLL